MAEITFTRHSRIALLVLIVTLFAASNLALAGEFLTRSIYVPIYFRTCPHLENSVLYQGDEVAGRVPGRKIFQFTYYPKLGRVEPELTQLRVEGTRADGEDYTARLAVTPFTVHSGAQRIELGTEDYLKRFRRKLDVRLKTFVLKLRCYDSCEKTAAAVVAKAEALENSRPR